MRGGRLGTGGGGGGGEGGGGGRGIERGREGSYINFHWPRHLRTILGVRHWS